MILHRYPDDSLMYIPECVGQREVGSLSQVAVTMGKNCCRPVRCLKPSNLIDPTDATARRTWVSKEALTLMHDEDREFGIAVSTNFRRRIECNGTKRCKHRKHSTHCKALATAVC